jgi:dihydrofolate reductase
MVAAQRRPPAALTLLAQGLTRTARRIEGFAIVSADGMIANAAGVMPDALKFESDKRFFERGLDRVDVVVHGRNSHERQPHSHQRSRLIVTRRIPSLGADPSNERALFWNPAGASFEQALAKLGTPRPRVGVIGGTDVFGLFLDLYDLFHLSRAPGVRLPGGRPVFPEVPTLAPEAVLARHGLGRGRRRFLDRPNGLTIETWRRDPAPPESTRGRKTGKSER